MIALTPEAARQVDELRSHYEALDRIEAIRALIDALNDAMARIAQSPGNGLPAPRPYPALTSPRRAWIKSGRYWVAYSLSRPPVIVGVFYDAADIPRRL